jgi:catechol 2,3-dioxygenase-like lactoylglutathione lyase family enzyme
VNFALKSHNKVARLLFVLGLLLSLAAVAPIARAQESTRMAAAPVVSAVESIGMTVSDMDRSIDFYSKVLSFEKLSDVEVAGSDYEHLEGVFGLRMRVVHMRLGGETIELTEYLTPNGRPFPIDSHGNDRWFQHIAIIVSDMDRAYQGLRQNNVRHASTGPQLLPEYIRPAAGIRAFYFRDPDGHIFQLVSD